MMCLCMMDISVAAPPPIPMCLLFKQDAKVYIGMEKQNIMTEFGRLKTFFFKANPYLDFYLFIYFFIFLENVVYRTHEENDPHKQGS